MRMVQLGTRDAWLRLTLDDSSGGTQSVIAELHSGALTARQRVVLHYNHGFADLAAFFQQLADEWRGWSGERVWESVEGDLRIEARHEYRHVQLRITVRQYGPGWGNEGWKATADLTMDPGEELSQAASDLTMLAAGSSA